VESGGSFRVSPHGYDRRPSRETAGMQNQLAHWKGDDAANETIEIKEEE
jgi:hypothetical protein